MQYAGGHVVVGGEDGGGHRHHGEQALCGGHARFEGELAGDFQRRVDGDAGFGEPAAVSVEAPLAGAVRGVAEDVRDPAMPERHEVVHHLLGGGRFVHRDGDALVLSAR